MKQKTKITVIGVKKNFPLCTSDTCSYTRECANHNTAGDFRTEGGLTPDLEKNDQGEWLCSKTPQNENGAILTDGTLANQD